MPEKNYRFITPSKDNVSLEDALIISSRDKLAFLEIISVGKNILIGKKNNGNCTMRYEDAVVLKKDGSYLIGENVIERGLKLNKFIIW